MATFSTIFFNTKILDHSANKANQLTIVYGKLYGSINDVQFPIARGSKILVCDRIDFNTKIKIISVGEAVFQLRETKYEYIINKINNLI